MAKTLRSSNGGISKLSDGRYRVSIEGNPKPDGRRNRPNEIVRGSEQDALNRLCVMRVQNNQPHLDNSKITVRDFFEQVYLKDMHKLVENKIVDKNGNERRRLATSTYRGYESNVRIHIAPSPFGDTPLCDLTVRGIKQHILSIKSPGAARKAWSTLRQGINYAVDECELLDKNPLPKSISHIEQKETCEQDTYTIEEFGEVIKAFKGHMLEPWLLVALSIGGSRSESMGLLWERINLEYESIDTDGNITHLGVVDISKSWQYTVWVDPDGVKHRDLEELPTKNGKRTRKEVLPECVRQRLLVIKMLLDAERPRSDGPMPLIPDDKDKSKRMNPNRAAALFKRECKRFGVKHIPPNNLRHSFATINDLLGADGQLVSAVMGHSNVRTRYNHYSQRQIEKSKVIAEGLNKALNGVIS
jgi:integrase